MALEDRIELRIKQLLSAAQSLSVANENGQTVNDRGRAACSAWLTSAQNIVHLVFPQKESAYRQRVDSVVSRDLGYVIHEGVLEVAAVLQILVADAEAVRPKASHAQWDEFDDSDVTATIAFTREVVARHLDA